MGKARALDWTGLEFSLSSYIYLTPGNLLKASESQLSYPEVRVLISTWEYHCLDWRVDVPCQVHHSLLGGAFLGLFPVRPRVVLGVYADE